MLKWLLKTDRYQRMKKRGRPRLGPAIGIVCSTLFLMGCLFTLPAAAAEIDYGNLEGTFALVNVNTYTNTNAAMLGEANSDNTRMLAEDVTNFLRQDENGNYSLAGSEEDIARIKAWKFEATSDTDVETYYLLTESEGTTKYLKVTNVGDSPNFSSNLTLVNEQTNATPFTITEGTGNREGQINLKGKNAQINLFEGKISNGFGGYTDNGDNVWFYLISDTKEAKTVEGITPAGTVINMFDYTVQDTMQDNQTAYSSDAGINKGHALKFRKILEPVNPDSRNMNHWTKNVSPYPDIVNNLLENGYPTLNKTEVDKVNKMDDTSYNSESLAYLFDPSDKTSGNYRKTYRNVSGLLQTDKEGYYYYDSQENFAELNTENNKITLYDTWGVGTDEETSSKILGQFFPFNKFSEVATVGPTNEKINHYFGMTLTARFVQQYDGHTRIDKKTPMMFEFSGDDDVWIFIDNVLVADLGGIHDKASVNIDFSTGKVIINEGKEVVGSTTSIYDCFENAGKAESVAWNTDTDSGNQIFANGSFHTLKFFYLERGNYASNLHLKYNLSTYPETAISKVDQYGNGVKGAKFAVYKSNENYNLQSDAKPVYTGVTDEQGRMVFTDEDDVPYTIAELEDLFGTHFILEETQAPEGYRQVGSQIHLEIVDHKILVCNNSDTSGAQTAATLQVDAPNNLKPVDSSKDNITYYDPEKDEIQPNGNVFAVVLRYIGPRDAEGKASEADLNNQANWAPVYGTTKDGFTIVDIKENTSDAFIQAAIDAVKEYKESTIFFQPAANGAVQGTLTGMPGDIRNYYYMLNADAKSDTEYTVAYYYTTANSIDEATPENTQRIDADQTDPQFAFSRIFGSTIIIPNLSNRMLVQKFGASGELVNGAKFAMYQVEEVAENSTKEDTETGTDANTDEDTDADTGEDSDTSTDESTETGETSTIYYIANDDTPIHLQPSADSSNTGTASLKDNPNSTGTYTIDPDTGEIKVTIGGGEVAGPTYTIKPVQKGTTAYNTIANEEGTVVFSNMASGQYCIREISAPEGYKLNTNESMVLVTENSIYANAGTENDGITVARGPGYIVSTLDAYASAGQIDNTLTWIYTKLKKSGVSSSFNDVTSEKYDSWEYIKNQSYLKYDSSDESNALFNYTLNTDQATAENASTTRRLYTDTGWSYLEIYQDYDFGSQQDHNGANYENWTEKGRVGDLSSFFSRSVYVQVTDEYDHLTESGITIKKVDQNGSPLKGAEFTLSRTVAAADTDADVTDKDDNDADGSSTDVTDAENSGTNDNDTEDSNTDNNGSDASGTDDNGADVTSSETFYYTTDGTVKWSRNPEQQSTLTSDDKGIIAEFSKGLPDGEYTLTETKAPNGYNELTEPITFIVKDGKITTVNDEPTKESESYTLTVENTKSGTPVIPSDPKGSLQITKTVLGSEGDTKKEFEFKVTLTDKNGNPLTGSFSYAGTESGTITSGGSITLKHGESATISGLPAGTIYKVEEVQANEDGYKTSSSGDSGTITANSTKTAAFINTKGTVDADLIINGAKTISGRNFKDGDTFKFTISRASGSENENAPLPNPSVITIQPKASDGNSINFAFGKITYTEKDLGKEYTYVLTEEKGDIEGLTYDTTSRYIVVKIEKGDDGKLKVTASLNNKTLDKVTWNNVYGETGDVVLNTAKQITGRTFADGDTFTFTISAPEGIPMPEKTKVTITPNAGSEAAVDFGKIHFTKEDIGKTYTYTLTEEKGNLSGMTYDTTEKTVTIQVTESEDGKLLTTVDYGNNADQVLWKNTYQSGDLTVSKTVSGDEADQTEEFHFTVTLDQKLSGTYGDMTFKDGVASFTLKHGESITAAGLPAGIGYTVKETEADQNGYTTSAAGSTGAIEADKTAQASFTNSKGSGDEPDDPNKPGTDDPNDPDNPDTDEPNDPDNPGTDDPNSPGASGDNNPKNPGSSDKPVINNEAPDTGDSSKPVLWITLCALAIAGMGFAVHIRPKHRRRRVRRK